MPHVLYNHITHSWDQLDLDDGCSESMHSRDRSPDFSPAAQRAIARLALGAGTALATFVVWGLVAGILLGTA